MATVEVEKTKAAEFLQRVHAEIPLTAAMQLGLSHYDGQSLTLSVPLAPNINDKGTAFAGSITALANITGWCLLSLWSENAIGFCRVAIAEAQFSFRRPIREQFTAHTSLPSDAQCAELLKKLREKGRCKVELQVSLCDGEGEAATLTALYAVWKEAAN
jgi:thioesterase domain-containing protein